MTTIFLTCLVLIIFGHVNSFFISNRFINHRIKAYTHKFAISNLNAELFQDIVDATLESEYPVVIDFQKSKCGPCIKIAPELERLSQKYNGKVSFYKIDADASKEALKLMRSQGIRAVPTFHIWYKGEMVDVISGARVDELDDSLRGTLMANSLWE